MPAESHQRSGFTPIRAEIVVESLYSGQMSTTSWSWNGRTCRVRSPKRKKRHRIQLLSLLVKEVNPGISSESLPVIWDSYAA